MKIDNINYTPIGYELGYCLGEDLETKEQAIYYFKGYPDTPYKRCEIVKVQVADINSFTSATIMGEGKDKNHKYFQGKIVLKGQGKLLSQEWKFIPNSGIKCDDVEVFFGMERSAVRAKLNNEQEYNFSRGNSEDNYSEFQNTTTSFRLSYNEDNLLQEIEFFGDRLQLDNVVILGGESTMNDIVDQVKNMGIHFEKQDYATGWLSKEFKTVIDSPIDLGGDGNKCIYFYTSSDISHLL